jgi:Tfp pilus assembly protein PilF
LALLDTDKAIEVDPKGARAYFTKALVLKYQHKNKEAVEVLRHFHTITPPEPNNTFDRYQAREWIRSLGGTI